MREYTLSHVRDDVLLRDLATLVAQDRLTTATLLAHMAEVDARRLYVPAGYPSMHAYCVEELRLSEDAAYKRIQAARVARQFPALFTALAGGRLHLAAVCLLAPHLTPASATELIEAATHRRKSEVEEWLARRFQMPNASARIRPIPEEAGADALAIAQLAPGQVGGEFAEGLDTTAGLLAPGQVGDTSPAGFISEADLLAPGQVADLRNEAGPALSECFLLQVTIQRSTREKLRYAQALLSHAVPTGEVAQVLDRALDALISKLERRKFGTGARRSSRTERSAGPGRKCASAAPETPRGGIRKRHVPAHVRRAVWERDKGQCTFVSASEVRCKTHRFLEFDHVDPVARGGQARVERMRLRCRAHNQYEAERAFGVEFMASKRQEGRRAVTEAQAWAAARSRIEARTLAEATARAAAKEQTQDVMAGLRGLGCRADEARRAAESSEGLQGATLEERIRAALRFLSRRSIQSRAPAEAFHPQSQV